MNNPTYLVFARERRIADFVIRDLQHPAVRAVYVSGPENLRGIHGRGIRIVLAYGFAEHRDWPEMRYRIKMMANEGAVILRHVEERDL